MLASITGGSTWSSFATVDASATLLQPGMHAVQLG